MNFTSHCQKVVMSFESSKNGDISDCKMFFIDLEFFSHQYFIATIYGKSVNIHSRRDGDNVVRLNTIFFDHL